MDLSPIAASFRDPAGHIVLHEGMYKRVVTQRGKEDYESLMRSGLYEELVSQGLLIPHTEEDAGPLVSGGAYKILCPEQLEFISYPYEWCFSQLRDAALLTLEIQDRALRRGLSLKDASAFNVQFRAARPVFVDTLSFETNNGGPWVAYEQFCRHFLAPLMLIGIKGVDANQHLKVHLDGLPLDEVSRLLGWRTYFRPGALVHIHLHARAQRAYRGGARFRSGAVQGRDTKAALASSLRSVITRLRAPTRSEWSGYQCSADHYGTDASEFKKLMVKCVVRELRPSLVYDLGGNIGTFARLVAMEGCRCVLYDSDPVCVDIAYQEERRLANSLVLPLIMDLRNPSPALGFGLSERQSLYERPSADLVLALALIHHLRLRDNIPLARLAEFLARLGRFLLIEFVPPEDPLIQQMIRRRGYVPDDYSLQGFVSAFTRQFRLRSETEIPPMKRRLFLFER